MLFANRTPTVNASATKGTLLEMAEPSTTRSRPLTTWYRVFDEIAMKTPADEYLDTINK
jgi:hypothetical protein